MYLRRFKILFQYRMEMTSNYRARGTRGRLDARRTSDREEGLKLTRTRATPPTFASHRRARGLPIRPCSFAAQSPSRLSSHLEASRAFRACSCSIQLALASCFARVSRNRDLVLKVDRVILEQGIGGTARNSRGAAAK